MTPQTTLIEPDWHTAYTTAYGCAERLGADLVPLDQAVGRVLAQDLTAPMDLPRDTTSAMDGWAVGSATGPWTLVSAQSLAGHPSNYHLAPGEAMRIATGGVIPPGTFGIMRWEYSSLDASGVHLAATNPKEPTANSHVRPSGSEARAGEVVLTSGTRLSPAHVGLAAMLGYDELTVAAHPTCQIFILGDEVLRNGAPGPGQVRDAFEPQFPAYARMLGLDVVSVEFVPDTLEGTTAALSSASADVVITTGGTAAGPKDFLHRALESLDAELVIDSIAMRPGHPNLLARRGSQFVVGLPGNPLSASLGGMLTLVRPLAAGLTGQVLPEFGQVRFEADAFAPAADSRLVPFTLRLADATAYAAETAWLNSGMLRGFATCDGVAVVPPGGVTAGDLVPTIELPW
ncbi:molybdopterin molybdotransferase MoeA [Timonella senegalensis]|uniref:molybdopterin molybdotransferase MoeA n=1 Tax=Timonella senegalensis TaxID=1465825 RepID=UPI002FDD051D